MNESLKNDRQKEASLHEESRAVTELGRLLEDQLARKDERIAMLEAMLEEARKPQGTPPETDFHHAVVRTDRVEQEKKAEIPLALKADSSLKNINAELAETHFKLGVAYFRLKKREEAMAEWQQTLLLQPEHVGARAYMERLTAEVPERITAVAPPPWLASKPASSGETSDTSRLSKSARPAMPPPANQPAEIGVEDTLRIRLPETDPSVSPVAGLVMEAASQKLADASAQEALVSPVRNVRPPTPAPSREHLLLQHEALRASLEQHTLTRQRMLYAGVVAGVLLFVFAFYTMVRALSGPTDKPVAASSGSSGLVPAASVNAVVSTPPVVPSSGAAPISDGTSPLSSSPSAPPDTMPAGEPDSGTLASDGRSDVKKTEDDPPAVEASLPVEKPAPSRAAVSAKPSGDTPKSIAKKPRPAAPTPDSENIFEAPPVRTARPSASRSEQKAIQTSPPAKRPRPSRPADLNPSGKLDPDFGKSTEHGLDGLR